MEEKKYSIDEICNWLECNDTCDIKDAFTICPTDVTHESIQKANQPPENEDQGKLEY